MITTRKPRRGTFDYLLDPIRDEVPHPPAPLVLPERDGRPPRIQVEIEIIQGRQASPQPRRGGGALLLTLLIVALLVALAGCSAAMVQQPKHHPSCEEITQTAATRYEKWMADDGISPRLLLAEDYEIWNNHGIAAFNWSNCNGWLVGLTLDGPGERFMMSELRELTKSGKTTRQSMDEIAAIMVRVFPLPDRPIIPKYDINPWTNRPYSN